MNVYRLCLLLELGISQALGDMYGTIIFKAKLYGKRRVCLVK